MNIAINLLPFRRYLAGAGRYARNLVHEFARMDRKNRYFLFTTPENKHHFEVDNRHFRIIECDFNTDSILKRIYWEQFVLATQLDEHNIEILFTPSVAIPLAFKGRKITTVHDIAYKKVPSKYPFLRRLYVGWMTRQAVQRSDVVFTDSDFSRDEIVREFGILNGKLEVARNGIEERFLRRASQQDKLRLRERYKLSNKFILCVGALEPSKNVDVLIKGFSELIRKNQYEGDLVLTGAIGWGRNEVKKEISHQGLEQRVKILGFVDDEDLPVLYALADVAVHLSQYEGFGFPVLEAMAAGTPVVAARAVAVEQLSSDAAVFVDILDATHVREALHLVLSDKKTTKSIVKLGLSRAKMFSWSKPARKILARFEKSAMNGHPSETISKKLHYDVSIVVISWNMKEYLGNLLRSVQRFTRGITYEIILIDNDSTDGTGETVSREFRDVAYVRNSRNRGVAEARNQGIRMASGKYIVILDADTILTENSFKKLKDFMDSTEEAGICGCQLVSVDGQTQPSARKFPTPLSMLMRRLDFFEFARNSASLRNHEMSSWDRKDIRTVDYVIGACQMIRRSALESVGLLDQKIFYGPEDVDYCLRMQRAGWKVLYFPKTKIVHFEQRATKRKLFSPLSLQHFSGVLYLFRKYGWRLKVS